jgi:hypothetical protein
VGFVLPLGAALYLAREAAAQVASGTRGRNSFPYEQAVAQLSEFAVYWALAAVLCWLAAAAFRLWRRPRERHAAAIEFLGEQDGAPERELKTRLVRHVLPTYPVERAYLARTRMGNESGVTVCLRAGHGRARRDGQGDRCGVRRPVQCARAPRHRLPGRQAGSGSEPGMPAVLPSRWGRERVADPSDLAAPRLNPSRIQARRGG